MRSAKLGSLTIAVAIGFTAAPLLAQERGTVELGFDAGVDFQITDDFDSEDVPNNTIVSVPGQRLRVGFWVSDQVSLEPGVSFSLFDIGDETLTAFSGDLSLLYNFGQVRAARPFLRAGGIVSVVDFDDEFTDGSISQFGLGGGAGVKIPATENLAFRLEAAVTRFFENDDAIGMTSIAGLVGLSFYLP